MLDRLQQDGTTVEVLVNTRSISHAEAVLAAGVVAANKPLASLKVAILHSPTSSAAGMLALCVTYCLGKQGDLDLEPLQALANLSELCLQQVLRADGVGKLEHLTHLELAVTRINCNGHAQFVSGLKMLSIHDSFVKEFHDDGISACSSLCHLSLRECCVCATVDQHTINIINNGGNGFLQSFPTSLSGLTQLTSLDVFGKLDTSINRSWLFKLKNLVCLKLIAHTEGTQHILTDHLGVLHALEHFEVGLYAPEGSVLSLRVSWYLMPLLQTIKIHIKKIRLESSLLGIARFKNLMFVDLSIEPADGATSIYFGVLVYSLAAKRPEVVCTLATMLPNDLLARYEASIQN